MTDGKCFLCGDTYSSRGMSRHIGACSKKNLERDKKGKTFHLKVGVGGYWIHLAVKDDTKLTDLDDFLRELWLECCGHLSAFTIKKETYSLDQMETMWEKSMDVELDGLVDEGDIFRHEYDFGNTTELTLKVVSVWEGRTKERISLLARNLDPEIPCACGKKATLVCSWHVFDEEGWLCEDCVETHGCDEPALLPVVNSPRTGACGYVG